MRNPLVSPSVLVQPVMEPVNVVSYVDVPTPENAKDRTLRLFIETYKSLPQLWDSSSLLYSNKLKRNEGLEKLLSVYRNISPHATLVDVRKKINTIRSNYRRELNKVRLSQATVADPQLAYKPSSWLYYALSFLDDADDVMPISGEQEDDSSLQESYSYLNQQEIMFHEEQSTSYPSSSPPHKKQKKLDAVTEQNHLLSLACKYLTESVQLDSGDQFVQLSKIWASKLRNLDPMQRKFAEKAINDILFEADLGTLHRHSVTINGIGNGVANTDIKEEPI